MSKNLLKNTFREIRSSFGRYGAILAIIVLGVGLFSGLGVCRETMIQIADNYAADGNMYDYRLLSTLGFTQEDVEAFENSGEYKTARGSYTVDVLVNNGGENASENAVRMHSMTPDINKVKLLYGKMPEKGSECLADPKYYSEEDIGKVIHISDGNDDDTKDMLAYDEYTITGIADFPYYLNIKRGTTNIGSGSINAYLCMPDEAFDSEIYHEIYLTLPVREKAYSKEYEDYIDSKTTAVEGLTEERANLRYEEIVTEIEDAETEIADNQKKIDDAKAEIADGKEQIAKNRADIEKNRADIDAAQQQMEAAMAAAAAGGAVPPGMDAQGMPADAAAVIGSADGPVQVTGQAQPQDFDAMRQELDNGTKELDEKEKEIQDNEKELQKSEEELAQAREDLPEIPSEPDTYVLTREENVGYAMFKNDSSVVSEVAKVFPVFFFLVAALVCITTMSRMIDEQRTQIGILKSLGYGNGSIMGKYFIYSGTAGIIGCMIGFFGGTALIPWVVAIAYSMAYTFLSGFTYVFNMLLFIISIAVALVCTVGITWLSCKNELRNTPATLLRPKAPKAGKRILLERITPFWKRLPFLQKLTLRNLFRYKRRLIMMILGISGCTALLVAGLGIRDSFRGVADNQYDKLLLYDAEVSFSDSLTAEEQEAYTKRNGGTPLFVSVNSADIKAGDNEKSVSFVAMPEKAAGKYVVLHRDDTGLAFDSVDGVYIDSGIAESLGIAEGDSVTITDGDGNTAEVKVGGVYQNYIGNVIYMDEEEYKQHFGDFNVNGAFVFFGNDEDPYEAGAALLNDDLVSNVLVKEEARDNFNSTVSSLDSVVIMLIVFAGALAFVVIYNLTNINITERMREIATVKVLGFYDNESASYVFRENTILAFLGAGAGLFLGRLLLAFVIEQLKVDGMNFTYHVTFLSYVLAVLFTLAFSAFVQLVVRGKLKRINMAESLKTVE